jgi:hypothetical protein
MNGAMKAGRKPKIFYDAYIAYERCILDTIRASYTFILVDSPAHIKQKLGLTDVQVEKIRAVMTSEGVQKAASLISPELLSHFIIMGDDNACAREIARIMKDFDFQVFTLSIPAIEYPKEMVQRVSTIIKQAQEVSRQ